MTPESLRSNNSAKEKSTSTNDVKLEGKSNRLSGTLSKSANDAKPRDSRATNASLYSQVAGRHLIQEDVNANNIDSDTKAVKDAAEETESGGGSSSVTKPTAGYLCKVCGKGGGEADSHWFQHCPLQPTLNEEGRRPYSKRIQKHSSETSSRSDGSRRSGKAYYAPPKDGYTCKYCKKPGGESDSHWYQQCPLNAMANSNQPVPMMLPQSYPGCNLSMMGHPNMYSAPHYGVMYHQQQPFVYVYPTMAQQNAGMGIPQCSLVMEPGGVPAQSSEYQYTSTIPASTMHDPPTEFVPESVEQDSVEQFSETKGVDNSRGEEGTSESTKP